MMLFLKSTVKALDDSGSSEEVLQASAAGVTGAGKLFLVFGLVGLSWALWCLYNFFSRNPACEPVGYNPSYGYMNPFGSGNKNTAYEDKVAAAAKAAAAEVPATY